MKRLFMVLLTLSFCTTLLVSCGEDKEQKIQDLQEQVQIEKQKYEKEQKARDIAQQEAAKSKSSFYLVIGISVVIALIALIGGVAMGSKSRKAVNFQNKAERNEDE